MAAESTLAEHSAEIIGALCSILLLVLGLLGWTVKRLIGKLEKQVDDLDTEVDGLHDRVLIMETDYDHCCRGRRSK